MIWPGNYQRECVRPLAIRATEAAASAEEVIDAVEPGEADDDQVDGDDVVEQPRHEQDQNAGDERNQRCDVGDRDGHGDLLGPGESTTKRNDSSNMSGCGHGLLILLGAIIRVSG